MNSLTLAKLISITNIQGFKTHLQVNPFSSSRKKRHLLWSCQSGQAFLRTYGVTMSGQHYCHAALLLLSAHAYSLVDVQGERSAALRSHHFLHQLNTLCSSLPPKLLAWLGTETTTSASKLYFLVVVEFSFLLWVAERRTTKRRWSQPRAASSSLSPYKEEPSRLRLKRRSLVRVSVQAQLGFPRISVLHSARPLIASEAELRRGVDSVLCARLSLGALGAFSFAWCFKLMKNLAF